MVCRMNTFQCLEAACCMYALFTNLGKYLHTNPEPVNIISDHNVFCNLFYHNNILNWSVTGCTYACVTTLVIHFNPGSNSAYSHVHDCWCLYYINYSHAVSPLTSCYIITSNGFIAMFACFTQVLPYQTYCLLDPNTKVGSHVYSTHRLINIAWHDGMPLWPSAFILPGSSSHQTLIGYFLLCLITMDSFLHSTVVAMSCPPHALLAICLWLIPAYSVRVGPIQQALAKITLGDRFQRGTLATEFWRTNI